MVISWFSVRNRLPLLPEGACILLICLGYKCYQTFTHLGLVVSYTQDTEDVSFRFLLSVNILILTEAFVYVEMWLKRLVCAYPFFYVFKNNMYVSLTGISIPWTDNFQLSSSTGRLDQAFPVWLDKLTQFQWVLFISVWLQKHKHNCYLCFHLWWFSFYYISSSHIKKEPHMQG